MGSWGKIEEKLRLGTCLRQLVLVRGQRSIEVLGLRSIVELGRSIVEGQVVAIGCIVEQVVAIGCIEGLGRSTGWLVLGCAKQRCHTVDEIL